MFEDRDDLLTSEEIQEIRNDILMEEIDKAQPDDYIVGYVDGKPITAWDIAETMPERDRDD